MMCVVFSFLFLALMAWGLAALLLDIKHLEDEDGDDDAEDESPALDALSRPFRHRGVVGTRDYSSPYFHCFVRIRNFLLEKLLN